MESFGIWEGNYVQTAIWGRRGQRLQPAIIKKGPTSCTAPLLAASSSGQSQELTSRSAVQNRKQSQQRLLGCNSNAMPSRLKIRSRFLQLLSSFPVSRLSGSPRRAWHRRDKLLQPGRFKWQLGLCFHLPQTAFIPQFPIETIPPSL